MKNEAIYTWNWANGHGYNSCTASSRDAAIRKAAIMGSPLLATDHRLIPNLSTLRSVTPEEMYSIDSAWASSIL